MLPGLNIANFSLVTLSELWIINNYYYYNIFFPQAAGIRLGTLIESLTGLVAAVAVGFAYSWIMAIVILGFMPIIAASSSLHFTLSAGSTKRTNKAIRESTEVCTTSMQIQKKLGTCLRRRVFICRS